MGCSSAKFLGGSCKVALNQSNHLGMMILRNSFTASAAGCTHACRVQRTPAPFIRNIENTSTAWLSIARISHYHCHNLLDTLICSTGFVTRDDSNILNFLQRNHVAELVYQYWGEIAGTHTHTQKKKSVERVNHTISRSGSTTIWVNPDGYGDGSKPITIFWE